MTMKGAQNAQQMIYPPLKICVNGQNLRARIESMILEGTATKSAAGDHVL
jgi:hypothetical protein